MRHDHANHDLQKFNTKRRTARRYGKNDRTITRWVHDPHLNFPQPVMINGRWYFVVAELDEFDRRLVSDRLRDLSHAQCDLADSNRFAAKKRALCAGGEA